MTEPLLETLNNRATARRDARGTVSAEPSGGPSAARFGPVRVWFAVVGSRHGFDDLRARPADQPVVFEALDVAPGDHSSCARKPAVGNRSDGAQAVEPTEASELDRRDGEITRRVDLDVDHMAHRLPACAEDLRTDHPAPGLEGIARTRLHRPLPGMNRNTWSMIHWSALPTSY